MIVMRHARPLREDICYGRSEVDVEPVASALHRVIGALADQPIERIVSSPALRCLELARAIAQQLRRPLACDERLRELDFGAWEGRQWSDIEVRDGARYQAWVHDWKRTAPPGGETLDRLTLRARCWLARSRPTQGWLVVTHAGVIRALRVLIDGCSWESALAQPVRYLETVRMAVAPA